MLAHNCAHGAHDDVVTECFKREMTRPEGQAAVISLPPTHKYDGRGGFATGSGPIPISACIGAGCFVVGAVVCVRLLSAAGFF